MFTETVADLTPCIPRTALASLLDLAQQAFANGQTELGERLIDLVHESYSHPATGGVA